MDGSARELKKSVAMRYLGKRYFENYCTKKELSSLDDICITTRMLTIPLIPIYGDKVILDTYKMHIMEDPSFKKKAYIASTTFIIAKYTAIAAAVYSAIQMLH
jgi:hypothetical protein